MISFQNFPTTNYPTLVAHSNSTIHSLLLLGNIFHSLSIVGEETNFRENILVRSTWLSLREPHSQQCPTAPGEASNYLANLARNGGTSPPPCQRTGERTEPKKKTPPRTAVPYEHPGSAPEKNPASAVELKEEQTKLEKLQ